MTIRALVFDAYGTLYDIQSVLAKAEALCPGKGEVITQVWRLKQLEYSWLRSLLQQYEDFWEVTRAALDFALRAAGVEPNEDVRRPLMENYLRLDPYPEAGDALAALGGQARDPLERQPENASKTHPEFGAGSVDRGRDQHRQRPNIQAAPVLLRPRRAGARRSEGGRSLRLVEQLRRRRRQSLRLQCRLDPP
jgi:HAD superfamily hydrolase (TIGR01493 family)